MVKNTKKPSRLSKINIPISRLKELVDIAERFDESTIPLIAIMYTENKHEYTDKEIEEIKELYNEENE